MRIKSLQVTNLRAFEHAEFEFMPGMNLLVGVNGVGKTTTLDALRICLSKIIPDITISNSRKIPFTEEDIRAQSNFMTVDCTFELRGKDFTFFVHKNRERSVPLDSNGSRKQSIKTPDKEGYYLPSSNSLMKINESQSMVLDSSEYIFENQVKLNEAEDVFRKNWEIAEELSDKKSQLMVLNNLGIVLERQAKFNEAGDVFRKSLEIAEELSDKKSQLMVLNNLGIVLERQAKFNEAEDIFWKSWKIAEELSDKKSQLMVLNNLVSILERQAKLNEAEKIFRKSLEIAEILGEKRADQQSLGLFFSTRRSLASDTTTSTKKAAGGWAGAYAEALSSRELRLAEIAHWMHAQEELGREHPLALKHFSALQEATENFLPECKNLRAEVSSKPQLIVDKDGVTLNLRQLSDGERGMFALVLDLAKRLSQANPQLDNPIREGSAIVLIDEIDLHLHPKWQRTVVKQLTETFPKCQFIATTHSPQIVAAVEPEQVLLLTDSGVIRPAKTLGMDSNWILNYLMDAGDRPEESDSAIKEVESLIIDADFRKAREIIEKYRKIGLNLPEWSVLEARMARMELLAK